MSTVRQAVDAIVGELEKVVFDKRQKLELVVTCLLADGHVLLEDVPGTAKTSLAKALAKTLGGSFRRLQCTPDLLPSDVTGSNVFDQKTSEFVFHPGPIFSQVLLADEVNRATPRAQAALLEGMAERQVTIEGKTYRLKRPFFVIATQNPIDHEGTFALPEAQLDRFLMRFDLGYPGPEAEVEMLSRHSERGLDEVRKVVSLEVLGKLQTLVGEVYVAPEVKRYIVELVGATRKAKTLALGASPRASIGLFRASQAAAAAEGRTFVLPDDVKRLYPPVLYHRVALGVEGRLARQSVSDAVDEAVATIAAPIVDPLTVSRPQ